MLKRIVIGWGLFVFAIAAYSQQSQLIQGKVINKKNGEPIGFAGIHILETDAWTTSDNGGNFTVQPASNPVISLEISSLGFEPVFEKYKTSNFADSTIEVKMTPISYDMDEITVLAKSNPGITSSSILGNAAIDLVQLASLADVMQLLPGHISANPDLSKAQKISLREVDGDDNSALGTAILIDGAPVSNNANLQTFSTSKSDNKFITTAGSGIDLRQISTDNIESIEFVNGIPSVTYGDLTSGAVLIKTKAGYTPWEVKLKTDALIKQFNIGKGFKLKSKSNVNFNFDYLQSYDDLRSKYTGFNRITAEVGYSKVFSLRNSPLAFNAKLSWFGTVDDAKTDLDGMVEGEKIKSENRGLRLNTYGKWSPRLALLTNLDYSFSISYQHQTSSEERYRSTSGIQMISTSMTEGENFGIFLPSEQFTSYIIDGKPVSAFFQLTASKIFNFYNGINNKVVYGFDYRLDANYGDGQVYSPENPPFVSSYTSRPSNYKNIPALQNSAVYLEDKLSMLLGKTVLDMQAGVRLNNFQSAGLLKSDLGYYFEPRFNTQFSFLSRKNSLVFDKMAIRVGIGKSYKSPPLLYLHPDKAYFDLSALSYYVGNPVYNTSVIDTRIFDTANPNLKPAENLKIEAGLILKVKRVSATLTAFREALSNGFDFTGNYEFVNYNRYLSGNIPNGTKPDISKLTKIPVTLPVAYQMPVNSQETQKSGVEYSIELGKISPIYTSFTVDGAWLHTKHIYSTIPVQYQPLSATSTPYLYVGVYPAGESKVSERLNTNCRAVTQIPALRLIFTTTAQMIWYDSYYFPKYNETPVFLEYSDGSTHQFTSEMSSNPNYKNFVISKSDAYYAKEKMPPLLQLNFKLAKEISDKMRLSFYVNNLVNHRPEYELTRTGSYIRRNPSIYFGAEIKIIL